MGLISTITDAGLTLARAAGLLPPPPQGRADTRERARRVAVPGPYWDRDPAMLGNALTPQRLTTILAERNEGYLQGWADLNDELVEHDPHLFSQLAIRAQSVVETDFAVVPGEGSNQKAARRAAAACGELLTHWKRREGEGGAFEDWLHEWVWGKFYGRSLHEVLWERDSGATAPEGLSLLDTRRLSLACDSGDPDPWALRIWDASGVDQTPFANVYGRKVAEFGADKFLPFEPRVRGSQKTREGLASIVVWYELFRVWSWRELMALAEMVSRPPVIGYYNAGGAQADGAMKKGNGDRMASAEERDAARRAVFAKTGALRAVLPDTVRLEALKYSLPTTDPVPLLTSRECDALISKAINGVANLSDLKAGARAAVEAQERTTFTFWRADCRSVERQVGRLFARYVRANPGRFGADCPLPLLAGKTEAARDTKAAGERIEKARSFGLRVPKKWAHRELEIPEPEDGEEVLAAPAPSPPPAPAKDDQERDPKEGAPEVPAVEAAHRASFARQAPTGCAVMLVPPPDVAAALAVPGGDPAQDLHVTLCFLGDTTDLGDAPPPRLALMLLFFAALHPPVAGEYSGVGRFSGDGLDAAYLSLDAPALPALRESLVAGLAAVGTPARTDHGFSPHTTLAYVAPDAPLPVDRIDPTPVAFAAVELWWGAARTSFPFAAPEPAAP